MIWSFGADGEESDSDMVNGGCDGLYVDRIARGEKDPADSYRLIVKWCRWTPMHKCPT